MLRSKLNPYYLFSMITLSLAFLILTGCGMKGSVSKNLAKTGTVAILLKDSPTVTVVDPVDGPLTLTQMTVTIQRIAIQRADDDSSLTGFDGSGPGGSESDESWLTVFDATGPDGSGAKVYDLLALQNTADLIALATLPEGSYRKIRLDLDTAPGSNYFCTSTCLDSSDQINLKVPSGRIDLTFHPPLIVTDDHQVNLVLDFIPDQSIHITHTGNDRFILRPVIRLGIIGDMRPANDFDGDFQLDSIALEEFEGTLTGSIDCKTDGPTVITLTHEEGHGTTDILVTSESKLYDGQGRSATCSDLDVGLKVEVNGTLRADGRIVVDILKMDGAEDPSDGLSHNTFDDDANDEQNYDSNLATTLLALQGLTDPRIKVQGVLLPDSNIIRATKLSIKG